ncbi:hypothetical protein PHJA_001778600 [Phtheirospermum japonicum]|uniref:Myb-like domain-containing protein n=1 Tax=Phtheirospermum japonicum TaxID=374723 RepID=A0A830CMQ7_9LAMI|nr:hypothetical protein PHJA_001778600 [Phtheirospermum japonicum]
MGAEMEALAVGGWGTWEELILGGAVLRHGTNDWNVVASELRARTFYPCAFTPQACKERYEDLQKRYSGSTAWFDELRKQRVAELKRALAISEDSIGSLESKIKSLKCESKHSSRADYGSNEISNNENSAGSFTKDTKITKSIWSFQDQDNGRVVVMRKRRGQRRVIKQHVDIGTIRSRIIGQSIKSAKELFRDLLLLANNALVFYSRRTREYKSAISLRHLVMKEYKKRCSANINNQKPTSGFIPCNPPVRPRTARPRPRPHPRPPPCEDKVGPESKASIAENVVSVNQEGSNKQSGFDDKNCLVKDRKGLKLPGKLKHKLLYSAYGLGLSGNLTEIILAQSIR